LSKSNISLANGIYLNESALKASGSVQKVLDRQTISLRNSCLTDWTRAERSQASLVKQMLTGVQPNLDIAVTHQVL
jgi:hypothetical protein